MGPEMNYELLLGLKPDVVLLYGIGDAQNCRNRQTERTVYTLYVCRRIFGGIAAW